MSSYEQVYIEILSAVMAYLGRSSEGKKLLNTSKAVSCIEVSCRLALSSPQGVPVRMDRFRRVFKLTPEEFKLITQAMAKVGHFETRWILNKYR